MTVYTPQNSAKPDVQISSVGNLVKHGKCPRFAKLEQHGDQEQKERNWKEAHGDLSPLLETEGTRFEQDYYDEISQYGEQITGWKEYSNQIQNNERIAKLVEQQAGEDKNSDPLILQQVKLSREINQFFGKGDADIVVIWPTDEFGVHVRVFDIKASWEEETYQQIQTAGYTIVLRSILEEYVSEDVNWVLEGGILHRGTEFETFTPSELPKFDLESRETDFKSILSEDDVFHYAENTKLENVSHQFDEACYGCVYNEACFTKSVEKKDIRLLGLTRGEQKILREYGFQKLEDIADIIKDVDRPKPNDYEEPEIKDKYSDIIREISEEHQIGEEIHVLAQKARGLLGGIDQDNPLAYDYPQWIIGSGNGSLPEDNPPDSFNIDLGFEKGSMIRVYLNIQYDPLQDIICLIGARVDCTNYNGKPYTVSKCIEKVPEDEDEQKEHEAEVLQSFLKSLYDVINLIAMQSNKSKECPLHFYFYTDTEREQFMESLKRNPQVSEIAAMRDLLGNREGIDQQMVSIVQREVETRQAINTLPTGLLYAHDQLSPLDESEKMDYTDWKYERNDGRTINAQQLFSYKFFDYEVEYKETEDGIKLLQGADQKGDGWYPIRSRFGSQLPLEYIWAAKGIEKLTTKWASSSQYESIIEKFQWYDKDTKEVRITRDDLKNLSTKLCQALQSVERSFLYKNLDINKEPIDVTSLSEYSLGENTLARSCLEYLDLEYHSDKQEKLKHYQRPIRKRILSGESIPIEIESATSSRGLLHADGVLRFDLFDFKNPTNIAKSTRVSEGDQLVATPLKYQDGELQEYEEISYPDNIIHSPPVTINQLNPDTNKISITGYPDAGDSDSRYRDWHYNYSTNPDSDVYFGPDQTFILDPYPDNTISEYARDALENVENNTLYQLVTELLEGNTDLTVDLFNPKFINNFFEWIDTHYKFPPNNEQREFISQITSQISLLQGPPGTGKTSGALAIAIAARLYSASKTSKRLRTLVTGPSNRSIDEVMENTAKIIQQYNETADDKSLNDVKIVRLVNETPTDPIRNVDYVNIHEDETEVEAVMERLKQEQQQMTITQQTTDEQPHIVVFATPSKVHGIADDMVDADIPTSEIFRLGFDFFDLYAVDEASMLDLPRFFLSGAFINNNSQVLISGDQRQMPPVHRHDWDIEDRRTIEQVAPFLSVLNYFRLLRGEKIDVLKENEEIDPVEGNNIPITRLQETYRCHTKVAEFLQRWIYSKDGINYKSSRTYTINKPTPTTEQIATITEPESPITLVLHDDEKSRQSNAVEATIARDLTTSLPTDESLGIVTPHNAQKGLLQTVCSRGLIDTVERFQGGERSAMIVSATVSDPDYLTAESEFILNPYRLNVALSRMQKKLVVIAPKTLFKHIPNDVDEYEKASIWKGLYSSVVIDNDPEWSGKLSDLVSGSTVGNCDANIEVYSS